MAILSRGTDVAVVWITAFHDDDSARRFEESYRMLLDRVRASTPHYIERRGSAVLVIAGAIANQSSTLASAVWKASKIGRVKAFTGPAHLQQAEAIGSDGVIRAQ